ncbi:hypothetical protein EG329_002865 [Mollisiaceae sp. DMI_Dod_QoI]|nr:hypothetical protein EG329_002865 [Helotiales sp. DMI_Dod_QoI]
MRQLECIYTRRIHPLAQNTYLAPSHLAFDIPQASPITSPQPHSSKLAPRSPTATRELALMHHYSTKVCLTFSATAISASTWKSFVVQEALQHDFLMNGLLGLSALHIAVVGKAPLSEEYVKIALEYQNRGLASFHRALSDLTAENCNAGFAFSVIVMMGAVISMRLTEEGNEKGPIENALLAFELLEGIRFVSKMGKQWLQPGPFGPVFDLWFLPASSPLDPSFQIALDQLGILNDSMEATQTEEQRAIFHAAISNLQTCFSKDKEMVLIWLAMAGKEFMSELRRARPMAMLIFLHWGVLLHRLNDEWWVVDSGKRLVEELSMRLLSCAEISVDATLWARKQVGLI